MPFFLELTMVKFVILDKEANTIWMSKAALDQCPLPRRSTNIWFNLCISGPLTLAILRTRARAFKIFNIPFKE